MTTIRTSLSDSPPAMLDRELRSSVAGMSKALGGVPPRFRAWRFDVTRSEKRAKPFGNFPAYAAVCLKAGASVSDVMKPLEEVRGWILSHLEQTRCIATALLNTAKESGEANTAGLKLMRESSKPTDAALDEYLREACEHRDALNVAIDTAYALRYGKGPTKPAATNNDCANGPRIATAVRPNMECER